MKQWRDHARVRRAEVWSREDWLTLAAALLAVVVLRVAG